MSKKLAIELEAEVTAENIEAALDEIKGLAKGKTFTIQRLVIRNLSSQLPKKEIFKVRRNYKS